ncbi:MAG: rhodanese-related sulfurtransferase [Tenericutes bacterium]|nr:rhodanese-related sulfurtransferase [Mycoplasmatota bacterium]
MNQYRILLYYHYTQIDDPETLREQHLKYCKELGLLGRVFISSEGINGTVSGTIEQTDLYMNNLKSNPLFKGIIFKIDESNGHAFKKMHVRVKNELVNFSLEDDINPLDITGKYVEPKEFYNGLNDPNTLVIDARNDYEYDLGHFKGALKPEIKRFRELPNWIRENKHLLKGKKILTYCTGGVRCEKFSGWLKKEGFDDVGQLHGGIVTYGKHPEVKGQLWEGNCYVFDQRISIPINQVNHVIVGKDYFTGEPCERYINCANPECNKQIICSEENEHKYLGSCSKECREHPRNRYVLKNK